MSTRRAKTQRRRTAETSELPVSTIQITFEGMMILFAKHGGAYCDVGILKHAPNHTANILVTRIPKLGAPETILHLHGDEFEPRMWLDVERFETVITLFEDDTIDFDRANDEGNDIDFRWVLDLEGEEMYKFKTPVDITAFKSILRINDGTFYTQQKSRNRLVKKPWREPETTLGKVAVRIRADIRLFDESAFFSNGVNGKPLELKPEVDVNYGIYVSQVRGHHAPGAHSSDDDIDAENYNFAVAVDQPYNRKIHFGRLEGKTTPDSTCLPPTMSLTELPVT